MPLIVIALSDSTSYALALDFSSLAIVAAKSLSFVPFGNILRTTRTRCDPSPLCAAYSMPGGDAGDATAAHPSGSVSARPERVRMGIPPVPLGARAAGVG